MSQTEPQFDNVDVDAVHTEEAQEQRDAERERSEAQRLADQITKSRAKKTIHVRVEGKRVPFHVLAGRSDDVEDMMGEFADVEDPEQDLVGEEFERFKEMRAKVDEILAEKCKLTDPATGAFTVDWWKSNFTTVERQEFLGDLYHGGIEGEDADGFRSE